MGVNHKTFYPHCAFEQLELQQIQSKHKIMFLFLIGHKSIIQVTGDFIIFLCCQITIRLHQYTCYKKIKNCFFDVFHIHLNDTYRILSNLIHTSFCQFLKRKKSLFAVLILTFPSTVPCLQGRLIQL